MKKRWVVVADSARARIFEVVRKTREIEEIVSLVHPESRASDRDLNTDRGGRTFDSAGAGRHAMSRSVSPHEHEASLFARDIAERLKTGLDAHKFDHLDISAPPAFLGLLRKHLDKRVQDAIDQTIAKNLITEDSAAIASHFFGSVRTTGDSKS